MPVLAAANQGVHSAVIGVVGSGPQSMSVRYIMAALYDVGARPILLDVRKPEALNQHLNAVGGVVIAGNSLDINPADYGAQLHSKTVNEDDSPPDAWAEGRDDYEYQLIDEVIKRGIPFLGICSGMQRLNVTNYQKDGGTLNQHIDGQLQRDHSGRFRPPHLPHETVRLVAGSQLASIIAQRELPANSLHHQHIDRVRNGFRPVAFSESGVIEAIEADPRGQYASHPLLMGVQWHPEYGVSPVDHLLMQHFTEKAAAYQARQAQYNRHADAAPKALHKLVRGGVEALRLKYGYKLPPSLEGANQL